MAIGILDSVCFLLNWSVIVFCLFMKIPQIKSSFGTMDTAGVSLGSVLLEMLGYSVLFCYGFAMSYPVSMYLEQCLLLIQNFFLLGLIIYTRNMFSSRVVYLFTIYFIACYCVAFRCVPNYVLKSVVFLKTPLVVLSKLAQIRALYKSKNPGKLNIVTWSMAAFGSYARLFTCIVKIGDWLLAMNYSCAASLSSTVVAMIFYYSRRMDKTK